MARPRRLCSLGSSVFSHAARGLLSIDQPIGTPRAQSRSRRNVPDVAVLLNRWWMGVRIGELRRIARRKILFLHDAAELRDLRSPPGNKLEALRGDRKGSHSIRINDQWRVVFVWKGSDAYEVEVVDYHR